jgi:hypothetical protein
MYWKCAHCVGFGDVDADGAGFDVDVIPFHP